MCIMDPERPRKMELLYTPRSDIAKMMKENSVSAEELLFLFASNKVTAAELRLNSPSLNDKLLTLLLKHWIDTRDFTALQRGETTRTLSLLDANRFHAHVAGEQKSKGPHGLPEQVVA